MSTNQLPKFHETFIPILQVLSDGKIISFNGLKHIVYSRFYGGLPDDLLQQRTKSGDVVIMNRIGWGKTYLKQAEMLSQPSRGLVQITEKGRKALEKGSLSLKEIYKDPEFLANRKILEERTNRVHEESASESSPQDLIDSGFRIIENQVRADLLAKLKQIDPYYFEKVVLKLFEKMGYGDFVETPKSGDGGIDGIINEDKLGLDKIFVQAKRYNDNKVREGEIRNFIGAISRDANKGIFVTTSSFDEKAINKARDAQQKIILIDGNALVDLMLRYGVGVQVKNTFEVKEVDEDFFEEN